MSFRGCLVIEGAERWSIMVDDQIEHLSLDVRAEELPICANLMLGLASQQSRVVVLAPASTSCFFCLLQPSEVVDVRDRQALLYELENHLPIDAESTVADFVPLPTSGEQTAVSAVAVDVSRWRGIVDAFESADLPVRSIVPAAVLATRAVCQNIELGETTQLYFVDGDRVDMIAAQSETILSWKHLPLNQQTIRRHQSLDQTRFAGSLVVGLPEQDIETIGNPENVRFATESLSELTIQGAQKLMDSPSARWFDLRRDALAPGDPLRAIGRQLRWVAVAAAACLLAIAIGGWWRTQRIENEIENVRSQQASLFQQSFPSARLPGALLRRVRSEHSKVLASRGENSNVTIPKSAPTVLRRLLRSLPADVRFRVTRIDVNDGQVDLVLQVNDTRDAGIIATAIEQAGFAVAPPGTRQLGSGGFESNLNAIWNVSNNESEAG